MKKIIELDLKENFVIVDPDIKLSELNDELDKHGFQIPLKNTYNNDDTINTIIMRGDNNMYNYLPHSKFILLGVRLKLNDGQVIDFGSKFIKDVTGYDFPKLFFGSKEKFGKALNYILRIYKKEMFRETIFIKLNDENNLFDSIERLEQLELNFINLYSDSKDKIVEISITSVNDFTINNLKKKVKEIFQGDEIVEKVKVENKQNNLLKLNVLLSRVKHFSELLKNFSYSLNFMKGQFIVCFKDEKDLKNITEAVGREKETNYCVIKSNNNALMGTSSLREEEKELLEGLYYKND